jgi:tRNA(Ile)-lysidine synthase
LREELGIELHAAHLNHQLRAADSDNDAGYVARLCHRLAVPVTIERRDVQQYQSAKKISLEEAAREVRYDFLAGVMRKVGGDSVVVGHTADDHVETILMHIIRGSGLRGLAGLQACSRLKTAGSEMSVIRPILVLSREDTADYCRSLRLKPRVDMTNLALLPLRNRIRHQLLPVLREYNPNIDKTLARMADLAVADIAYMENAAAAVKDSLAQRQGNCLVIDRKIFSDLPLALKRYCLRACISEILSDIRDIEACHIEELLELADKPAGKTINLPGGITFTVEYGHYILGVGSAAVSPYPPLKGSVNLAIPGETAFSGWGVKAGILTYDEYREKHSQLAGFTAALDFEKTGSGLMVRARQAGDRFQPLGMDQSKKLNVFMIDARIPRSWRSNIPLVCRQDQIIWAVGYRIEERFKVNALTQKVLLLEFSRQD